MFINSFAFGDSYRTADVLDSKWLFVTHVYVANAKSLFENAWEYLDKGKIKPIIQREFLLSDASEAHKTLEIGDHVGKFLMKVS